MEQSMTDTQQKGYEIYRALKIHINQGSDDDYTLTIDEVDALLTFISRMEFKIIMGGGKLDGVKY